MGRLERNKGWWWSTSAHSISGVVGKDRKKESEGIEVCCDCPSLGLGVENG